MFRKVLVANRGEIAVRVIRTLKYLGVRSVAIYSDADREALHVKMADEAYRIGPPAPAESYLNQQAIVRTALKCGAEAIHPGYGFLSENSYFVKLCEEEGVVFIGPASATLEQTGDKSRCRQNASALGVPVTPGSKAVVEDVQEAIDIAEKVGYPVMLKSAYGGGGLGIREAKDRKQLEENWSRALSEAKHAFGRSSIYVEKLVKPARHIEIQVLSDGHGNYLHLGERECSIQRRHQKLVELTPSPVVDDVTRKKIGEYAIKVARSVNYTNAGTVEFLRNENGDFYFMEVNSRLQVEHPITEEVTGVDMVAEQVRVAAGDGISFSQTEVVHTGAAIECRVTAEDPLNDFTPDSGTVMALRLPGGKGVRVDTALYEGYTVPEYYDSLIAKLIAKGRNLDDARRRMLVALDDFSVTGIRTSVPFHQMVLDDKAFVSWNLNTDFISENDIMGKLRVADERKKADLTAEAAAVAAALIVKGVHRSLDLEGAGRGRRGYSALSQGGRFYDNV